METYLVDTDIIIYWLRGKHPQISQKIEEIDSNALRLSAITVAELYFGAHNSSKPQENLQLLEELLAEVQVIPFEVSTAAVFGQVKTQLRQSGYTISDSDIFIAATALAHGMILVTNNEKHFGLVARLMIENWMKI
jgi:tRNA(fMet)-specific endonuclease VapC